MIGNSPISNHRFLFLTVVAWGALVLAGFWAMAKYEFAPGIAATVAQWPAESALLRVSDRPTLVVFAHPQCSCMRATIAELEKAMVRCGERVAVHVCFFKPAGASAGWAKTVLWSAAAAAIAGVSLVEDADGAEARRFGSETSGQSLLFSANGLLMFSVGVTAARGHVGDNDGRGSVVALAYARSAEHAAAPLFGCSLVGRSDAIFKSVIP